MARPNRIKQIAAAQVPPVEPDEMVLDALNSHETLTEAAEVIGVSPQALSEYTKSRFEKICRWDYLPIEGEIIDFKTTVRTKPIDDEGQSQ